MDMQALSQQQQNEFLASLFPSSDAQNGDAYHNAMRSQGGRSNGSPASSSSSGPSGHHDGHGGSSLIDSSTTNIRSNSNNQTTHSHNNSGSNSMYPPSSPIQPQSPNSQLTMQLLGNLMQMQGSLDNNFGQTPSSGYTNQNTGGSSSNLNYGPNFSGGMNASGISSGNLGSGNAGFGNPAASTAILEQQIKLQQLQQLQQLQNQIFQQQIALISGQSPPIAATSPAVPFDQSAQSNRLNSANVTSPHFTGLATPGPSNELRPQQPHLDFDHFSQPLPSPMTSHSQHSLPFAHHSNDFIHRGTSSAPEHVAFHIRTGPTPSPHFTGGSRREVDLDISPLTSPWMGPQQTHYGTHSSDRDSHHDHQRIGSNKRAAPDEASHARKKHTSAMSPVIEDFTPTSSGTLTNSLSSGRNRPYHKGSKSTTSTPLLRGSRSRSKSGAGNAYATSPLTTHGVDTHGTSGGNSTLSQPSIPVDTPSPVDLSMPPPPAPATVPPDPNRQHSDEDGADFTNGMGDASASNSGPQLTPLTPGVIMKLGPFGTTSTSSTGTSTPMATPAAGPTPAPPPPSKSSSRSRGKSESKKGAAALKPILPVHGGGHGISAAIEPSANAGAAAANGPPKKVSHKDAEQKRRDSQKTAYDELRRLLPPITFEDDQEETGAVFSRKKDEVIPVRGPLPPGALPPRGPPKAGGEGPNKGVSKLQLLICGNQYIRTLKGRVERRDGEIENLRREIVRLRQKVNGMEGRLERARAAGMLTDDLGMDVDGFDLDEGEEGEVDLEKDLDAVEGMGVHIGLVGEYDEEEGE